MVLARRIGCGDLARRVPAGDARHERERLDRIGLLDAGSTDNPWVLVAAPLYDILLSGDLDEPPDLLPARSRDVNKSRLSRCRWRQVVIQVTLDEALELHLGPASIDAGKLRGIVGELDKATLHILAIGQPSRVRRKRLVVGIVAAVDGLPVG